MPEGDTVFVSATRLNKAFAGATLTRTDFRVPAIATVDLSGRKVIEVAARGKHLLFRIEGGVTLHTHYKMEGEWHLYKHGERWRGPGFEVRAVLETADWIAVGFRLAVTELIDTVREDDVVGHLGPDPLNDWDAEEALRRFTEHPARSVGDVLLDQRVIAGPGNVYRCEACFLAGYEPWAPIAEIADPRRFVDLVARLLQANRTLGLQVTTGDRRPGRERWVYGRGGKQCRRCGTLIRRREEHRDSRLLVTYWCPHCQPASAVSANG